MPAAVAKEKEEPVLVEERAPDGQMPEPIDIEIGAAQEPDVDDKGKPKPAEIDLGKASHEPVAEEDPVAVLRKQRDEAIARANQEANLRRGAEQREAQTMQTVGQLSANTIEANIAAVKSAADQAQERFVALAEAGKFKEASAVQRELARYEANLLRLEEQKYNLEANPPRVQQAPAQQSRSQADILADHIEQRGFSKSASWIRAHPDHADPNRLDGAHKLAVSDGLTPETDAYFDRIEELLKVKKPVDNSKQQQTQTVRQAPAASAPPSRESSAGSSAGPRTTIRLSSEQRDMARHMNMTDKEYAEEVIAAEKDPRYVRGGRR